ncbi:MAG: SusC/RagA family TonB-linked outer membrane protein [Marinilabiliaceae bacterium]|nr:SusC/RagA family TonB-linked outer membrane protein [Marinilabiliaceae bacterium]
MKLSVLMMLIGMTSVFASETYSQTTKLSLKVEEKSLEEFLTEIEQQSEFRFFYTGKIDVEKKVSGEFKNKKITDILDGIKEGAGFQYEVMGRQVILSSNNAENAIKSIQQQKNITGRVTDDAGEPLPGVNVYDKSNPQNGVITGGDGAYSIAVSSADAVLIYSFIGMDTQEIIVGSRTVIDIEMTADAINLDEVVAVGYGTMTKRDLTGSVVKISSDKIESSVQTNAIEALAGRVGGVLVSQGDGAPGGNFNVQIRGVNSINGSSAPLYVVDGYVGVDPKTIDAANITSMEILKDASAAAIYGSRGANGVIIITTKSPKIGGASGWYANYGSGFSEVVDQIEMLNPGERYSISSLEDPYKPEYKEYAETYKDEPGINWQDHVLRKAKYSNFRFGADGSSGKTTYGFNAGVNKEEGILITTGFKRMYVNLMGSHKFNQKLTIKSDFGFTYGHSYGPSGNGEWGEYWPSLRAAPHNPVKDLLDGDYMYDHEGNPITDQFTPVTRIENTDKNGYSKDYRFQMELVYEVIKDLKFTARGTYQGNHGRGETFMGSKSLFGSWKNGIATLSYSDNQTIEQNYYFNYKKNISSHRIELMSGFTESQNVKTSLSSSSNGFSNEVLGPWGLPQGQTIDTPGVGKEKSTLKSFIGRFNYSFNDRYLLTATFRADGASKFGDGNQWGYFPAISGGWRIHEEEFIKQLGLFSNFKLRASYGINGSQGIEPYSSLSKYSAQSYSFDNNKTIGIGPAQMANPDLRWEKTAQTNIGLDMGFFKNRIAFTFDVYHKKTTDLLYLVSLPATSGFTKTIKNIGSLENKGFDIELHTRNLTGKFKWETSFNISANRNKVLSLEGENDYKILNSFYDNGDVKAHLLKVDEPIGLMYGYVCDGVYRMNDFVYDETINKYILKGNIAKFSGVNNVEPGYGKFRDITGDGIVNDKDRTVIGNANPDFYGGISNDVSYQGFHLAINCTYQVGGDIMNLNNRYLKNFVGGGNYMKEILDYWTPENDDSNIPKPGYEAQMPSKIASDLIEDASYFKLNTISLSYDLPKHFAKKIFLKSASVGVSAKNIYTWSNYSGINPQASSTGYSLSRGVDFATYPTAKTYSLNLNIKL